MSKLSVGHVFISYSRRDDLVMRRVVAFLRKQGIKAWVDNERLIPGTPIWEQEIEKAINGAYAVVVILSPDAKNSEWVRREITYADQYHKRVFPVLVNGDEDSSIPLRLITRQFVDIRTNEDIGLNSLSAAVTFYSEEVEAREKIEREEAGKLARAQAEREAAEREAARMKSERDKSQNSVREALEKAAKEQAAREAAEEAARLAAEKAQKRNVTAALQPNLKLFAIIGFVGLCCLASGIWGTWSIVQTRISTPTTVRATSTQSDTTPTIPTTPTATGTPDPQELLDIDPTGNRISMRLVPAGEFIMGSEAQDAQTECNNSSSNPEYYCWFEDEKPPHTVSLDEYYIDTFEVSNALYGSCVEEGACEQPIQTDSETREDYFGNAEYANYPVIYVTWEMANTYCEWRGASLPTEAQWEKAAKGVENQTYAWGEESSCERGNFLNCIGDTTPVGNYVSGMSPYGLYDMSGNIWEWVADWYDSDYYANSPSSNPQGPSASISNKQIARGGAWQDPDYLIRTSYRNEFELEKAENSIGFRCARTP